jgi:hypothetical protein
LRLPLGSRLKFRFIREICAVRGAFLFYIL